MSSQKEGSQDWLVWDLEEQPESSDSLTILWQHSAEGYDATRISITAEVEAQADALRRCYLGWIYDLSQTRIYDQRLIDQLKLRPELSYWWLCAPAQKFNLAGNNGIDDTIKLLALERMLKGKELETLRLQTKNAGLARSLELLCQAYGIGFSWVCPKVPMRRRMLDRLPSRLRALVYLCWYSTRTLRCTGRGPVTRVPGGILFMDILVHLNESAAQCGRFDSNYWTTLVEQTKDWGRPCIWGHLFYRHGVLQTPADAASLIKRFNETSRAKESHFLLEAYFGWGVFLTALKDYLRLGRMAFRLRSFVAPPMMNSRLDPWPLHQIAWNESLTGREALLNCLRLALFEKALRSLPHQRLGVYIAENQPWELAFIHAWRVAGHGKLIGVPHTTVRFWDLRYHQDTRTYDEVGHELRMPQPDVLAINGSLARSSLLAGGYPEGRLRDVEALRFLHLLKAKRVACSTMDQKPLCVLVCGDFHAGTNARLLAWLKQALKDLPAETRIIVKPHPAFCLGASSLPISGCTISDRPIDELLQKCNVVFTSNTTSAAVDAFCAGVPVVQMMDGRAFNTSPLRGIEGVQFAYSAESLAKMLLDAQSVQVKPQSLFNIGLELNGWRRLLDEFTC